MRLIVHLIKIDKKKNPHAKNLEQLCDPATCKVEVNHQAVFLVIKPFSDPLSVQEGGAEGGLHLISCCDSGVTLKVFLSFFFFSSLSKV